MHGQIKGDITVQQSDGGSRSGFPRVDLGIRSVAKNNERSERPVRKSATFRWTIDGTLKRFKKTYSLSAPPIGDKAAYSIQGEGTWVFDTEKNLIPLASFHSNIGDRIQQRFGTGTDQNLLRPADQGACGGNRPRSGRAARKIPT